MQFTDEQINQFQELYRKRYHKEITKQAALEQALKLVGLVEIFHKPITQKEYETLLREEVRMLFRHARQALDQYQKDQDTERPVRL